MILEKINSRRYKGCIGTTGLCRRGMIKGFISNDLM
ncbi:unnamed protein product [Musa acuminata subsp. malaccensis]|uniref:(wild Malaysian banana) hypothetical protein n=1 Tax=Musa acuminata subsp. malaccensis TaxID=214687 RepID=A0A804HWT7_MUSAM|nr:unnamed protein product [Musa acuminata subsp. malaccensis]